MVRNLMTIKMLMTEPTGLESARFFYLCGVFGYENVRVFRPVLKKNLYSKYSIPDQLDNL